LGGDRVGAEKIGCTAQTLNEWINKAEVDACKCADAPTDMVARIEVLERQNRVLRSSAWAKHADALRRISLTWCRHAAR
jgi:hypothetical protein